MVPESLGKSLVRSEIDGLFIDILRQLLSAIFRLQEEELAVDDLREELKG